MKARSLLRRSLLRQIDPSSFTKPVHRRAGFLFVATLLLHVAGDSAASHHSSLRGQSSSFSCAEAVGVVEQPATVLEVERSPLVTLVLNGIAEGSNIRALLADLRENLGHFWRTKPREALIEHLVVCLIGQVLNPLGLLWRKERLNAIPSLFHGRIAGLSRQLGEFIHVNLANSLAEGLRLRLGSVLK